MEYEIKDIEVYDLDVNRYKLWNITINSEIVFEYLLSFSSNIKNKEEENGFYKCLYTLEELNSDVIEELIEDSDFKEWLACNHKELFVRETYY